MSTRPAPASQADRDAPAAEHPEFVIAMRGYDRAQVDDYMARLMAWVADGQARTEAAERSLAAYSAHIAELEGQISELRAASSPSAPVEAAAARAAEAIESALHEADAIRARARAEADAVLQTARQQAVETVRSAQQSIVELERLANADRSSAADALELSRRSADEQVADLLGSARAEADRTLEEAKAAAEAALLETERICTAQRQKDQERHDAAQHVLAELRAQRDEVVEHLDRLRGAIESMMGPPAAAERPEKPGRPERQERPATPRG